ncbi:MAG: hypothetical protein JO337_06835 [Acidimicrobiales bacterium]|nr:hypothetical protein [Acidimicrobiales bacterium]
MPKRPDIALITPYPSPHGPSTSGVAWYAQHLARSLTDQGAHVAVIAPANDRPSFELDGKVPIIRTFGKGPRGLMRAAGVALRTGAPVSHLQHEAFLFGGPGATPGLLGGLARLRRAGAGPVVTMHQVVAPGEVDDSFVRLHHLAIPTPIARAGLVTLQGSIRRIASRTIVHEEAFAAEMPGAVVVPMAARGWDGRPSSRERQQHFDLPSLRQEHDIAKSDFLVLCFGFVAPYKGIEAALAAAELAGPTVRVVVAGAEHPRLAGTGYLDGLIRRYGHVARFTGYVPDDHVGAWFEAADAALLAYPQVFSSSAVLALAAEHGVPALLSPPLARVAGFPAEVAAPLEPRLLAERFDHLARRGPDLTCLEDRTRRLGEGRSWPNVARRHLEIYEEVTLGQRGSSLHGRR